MAKTSIEWTDATWNPVTGCDRTSPGCDNCYALTLARRLKAMGNPRYQVDGDPRTSGPGFAVTLQPDQLALPLGWRTPRRVFVNSMSDLFHPDVPDDFVGAVWQVMAITPRHTYQVLTKRPQRMARLVSRIAVDCNGDTHLNRFTEAELAVAEQPPLPNVWLGTSIESDRYTFRAGHLRETKAAVRFLSCEPLLGPLPSLDLTGIDWVIVGGESGPGARPMHPAWVRTIRDRCEAKGIPFFFKQWGEFMPTSRHWGAGTPERIEDGGWQVGGEFWPVWRVGKHKAGRLLDGRTWDEMPTREPRT